MDEPCPSSGGSFRAEAPPSEKPGARGRGETQDPPQPSVSRRQNTHDDKAGRADRGRLPPALARAPALPGAGRGPLRGGRSACRRCPLPPWGSPGAPHAEAARGGGRGLSGLVAQVGEAGPSLRPPEARRSPPGLSGIQAQPPGSQGRNTSPRRDRWAEPAGRGPRAGAGLQWPTASWRVIRGHDLSVTSATSQWQHLIAFASGTETPFFPRCKRSSSCKDGPHSPCEEASRYSRKLCQKTQLRWGGSGRPKSGRDFSFWLRAGGLIPLQTWLNRAGSRTQRTGQGQSGAGQTCAHRPAVQNPQARDHPSGVPAS